MCCNTSRNSFPPEVCEYTVRQNSDNFIYGKIFRLEICLFDKLLHKATVFPPLLQMIELLGGEPIQKLMEPVVAMTTMSPRGDSAVIPKTASGTSAGYNTFNSYSSNDPYMKNTF